jgi:hypothetical protein
VTKEEFRGLLLSALEIAIQRAEKRLGRSVPRGIEIEFNGLAPGARMMTVEDALEALYLGPDKFFRIVDVAVLRVLQDRCVVFMCFSGHRPASFSETWNQPEGSGPFKQLDALRIEAE